MATSILNIVYKVSKQGGADQEVLQGITKVKAGLAQAGVVAATFVAAYYAVDKVLDATVGVFADYAQQVREGTLATGLSAEEMSRVIQFADDLGVSYEDLSASIKKNADTTDFSIQGLAKSSEEYLKLSDATDKAKYAQELYGKQWVQFSKILEQGPDAIMNMSAAIDSSLIITDDGIKKAEEYRIANDDLADSILGLKVEAGSLIIGPYSRLVTMTTDLIGAFKDAAKETSLLMFGFDDLARVAMHFAETRVEKGLEEQAAAAKDAAVAYPLLSEAARDAAAAHRELQASVEEVDYSNLLDMTFDLQKGFDGFAEKQADIQSQIDGLDSSSEDYASTLADLKGELDANAKAQDLWAKKLVFSMLQARLATDGTTAGEFAFLIGLAENMGLVDAKTATLAQNLNDQMNNIDYSNVEATSDALQKIFDLPDSKTVTVTVYYQEIDIGQNGYYDGPIVGVEPPPGYIPGTGRNSSAAPSVGGGGGTPQNVLYNPVFNVYGASGIQEVLDALS